MKPLLKIFNECRSVTGVGELNPYRRSSTNVEVSWDSGSLMKEPPVRCTQQIVSDHCLGNPKMMPDQPMNLWRMARIIAGKDARSWASRAAGVAVSRRERATRSSSCPTKTEQKKVGKTVAASGLPEFMGRRPSSRSPSGALRWKPKSSRQWFWAKKWLKKRWL